MHGFSKYIDSFIIWFTSSDHRIIASYVVNGVGSVMLSIYNSPQLIISMDLMLVYRIVTDRKQFRE